MKYWEQEKNILAIWNHELQKGMEAIKTSILVERERVKIANDNPKKYWETKMKDWEEEKEILVIPNKELQKELEAIKTKARVELEQANTANDNLNKYWDSKVDCEEENEILVIRNQEVQKELEANRTSSSHTQRGRQCGIGTPDDGKVSLDNFQFNRRLGECAFGTLALATWKLLGGPEKLYAINALKQRIVTSSNICGIMAEKEAFTLTSCLPFIATLYCCFQ